VWPETCVQDGDVNKKVRTFQNICVRDTKGRRRFTVELQYGGL